MKRVVAHDVRAALQLDPAHADNVRVNHEAQRVGHVGLVGDAPKLILVEESTFEDSYKVSQVIGITSEDVDVFRVTCVNFEEH